MLDDIKVGDRFIVIEGNYSVGHIKRGDRFTAVYVDKLTHAHTTILAMFDTAHHNLHSGSPYSEFGEPYKCWWIHPFHIKQRLIIFEKEFLTAEWEV